MNVAQLREALALLPDHYEVMVPAEAPAACCPDCEPLEPAGFVAVRSTFHHVTPVVVIEP